MKRKLQWLAIILAVSLLGFGTALLLWPRDRITAESSEKIQIGMTESEVEDILGEPGIASLDLESQFEVIQVLCKDPLFLRLEEGPSEFPENIKVWLGRRGLIWIEFEKEDRVRRKVFRVVHSREKNFIDGIRDWLGW
jgi:hypothetical protein